MDAATGQLGAVASMTFDQAAGRWWAEVGIRRGDAVDVERRVERLIKLIGAQTRLGEIGQAEAAAAIERRRAQTFSRAKPGPNGAAPPSYPVSDSTVNRDVVETLRPILKRARTHWTPTGTAHGLPDIDWRVLRLGEPRGLSRLYSAEERAGWVAATPDDLRLATDMLLTYGLRFGELLFPPEAFRPGVEPVLALQKGRKRDVILYLPIRQDHAAELTARLSRAEAAGLDHLWFYEGRTGPETYTRSQIEYRLTKAADAAGITGGRRIHGARHHAGSTMLQRSGGNLKAVQGLLGHADIGSSQRYAHVLTAELRAILEGDHSRNSPEPETTEAPQAKEA